MTESIKKLSLRRSNSQKCPGQESKALKLFKYQDDKSLSIITRRDDASEFGRFMDDCSFADTVFQIDNKFGGTQDDQKNQPGNLSSSQNPVFATKNQLDLTEICEEMPKNLLSSEVSSKHVVDINLSCASDDADQFIKEMDYSSIKPRVQLPNPGQSSTKRDEAENTGGRSSFASLVKHLDNDNVEVSSQQISIFNCTPRVFKDRQICHSNI